MPEMQCPPASAGAQEPRAYWCPTCAGGSLRQKIPLPGSGWDCGQCGAHYPTALIGKRPLPWLFPNPEQTRSAWRQRVTSFARANEHREQGLAAAIADLLKEGLDGEPAHRRLTRAHQGQVRLQATIGNLLAPLDLASEANATGALVDPLPAEQGLLSYFNNLFRDWNWENGETSAMLDAINQVLKADPRSTLGHVLTLGSGAARLSYDLHSKHRPDSSTLLDLNPLLMVAGMTVMDGGEVLLPEEPLAPSDIDDSCTITRCALPEGARPPTGTFSCILGDACAPPFASESFDTVLTPWLIDILPVPLPQFAATVNRLLPIGGRWVNTGSLAFAHSNPRHNYAPDELGAVLEAAGFELRAEYSTRQRYMHSPRSGHGRMEMVYTFSAVKRSDVPAQPVVDHRLDWQRDDKLAIPLQPDYALAASQHLLNAQVLGAIDGQRSLGELSALLAEKYQLQPEAARRAIEAILAALR